MKHRFSAAMLLGLGCIAGCAHMPGNSVPPTPAYALDIAIERATGARSRETLHRVEILATSGVEAQAEDATLVSYPALFSVPPPASTNEPPPPAPDTATRQVGADLTALATAKPGTRLVNVCVSVRLVQVAEWRTNSIWVLSGTNRVNLVAEQPVFRKLTLDTCVDVPLGKTVEIGKPMRGGATGESIVITVGARNARERE